MHILENRSASVTDAPRQNRQNMSVYTEQASNSVVMHNIRKDGKNPEKQKKHRYPPNGPHETLG